MKKLMPIIAAGAILLGSACNTYTSSTDPADYGSGWGLNNRYEATGNPNGLKEQEATGHTSGQAAAEANNNATFDNKTITANKDSVKAIQPKPDSGQAKANSATPITTGGNQ